VLQKQTAEAEKHQRTAVGGEKELKAFKRVCDVVKKDGKRLQKIQIKRTSLNLSAVWRSTSPDPQ